MIDPKGGMEFAAGHPLFARYCYGDDNPKTNEGKADSVKKAGFEFSFVEFLEAAVAELRARQARLRGIFRTHKARPGDPHIVMMIDEFASLTAYVVDREARKRIEAALNLLLSQGRAVGITVIAARRTRARKSSTCADCSPPGSRSASPNPTRWTSCSARAPETAEHAATRSANTCPAPLRHRRRHRRTAPGPLRLRRRRRDQHHVQPLRTRNTGQGLHLVDGTDDDPDDKEEAA